MSVADSIFGALQRFGRPMTLRRLTLAGQTLVPLDVEVFGRSKLYSPEHVIGTIIEGDTQITITNKEILAAQWPGPPRKGDKLVVDGLVRNIEAAEPKYLGTEILVFVCQVRG